MVLGYKQNNFQLFCFPIIKKNFYQWLNYTKYEITYICVCYKILTVVWTHILLSLGEIKQNQRSPERKMLQCGQIEQERKTMVELLVRPHLQTLYSN